MNIKFFNAAKRDAVTRFLAPVAVAFFSVFLASCPNSADNVPFVLPAQQTVSSAPTVSAGGTAANAEAQFITFRGSVRTGGALPASYAKALEGLGFGGTEEGVEGLSKSARPDVTVNGTSIEHFAVATPNSGEPVEGTFASASSTTFEMPLAIGKTWNIVCGIRNVSGDKKIIMSDSFQMEVTVSNSVLSHVFMLTPYTEVVEGVAPSGNVSLLVNFEGSAASDGASVSASWEDPALPALTVEGLDPAHITASGVPVGNHRLAIFFRDPNGVSVYETVQVVTVLNGLTTETWMPETGEAAFTSGGHFVVDNDVIQGAASDRIYVGKPAALASNDSVRASDSNSGSAYSPLEHLQAAFNKIQSAGSGSKDFKIFVSGEAVGNATLDVVRGTHARSITIEGLDDPDESSKPKSALKGSGSGSVFTIASSVPVTIKNLKITGGSGAGQGGGISMASGSDLTLDSGALVTQNSATQQGGGVYNRDGSLKIKKGAAISGNWITSAGESGSDGGAGLFMYGSSAACVMTGGEISDNNKNASYNDKNVRGGGVRLGGSARMTLSGGSVSGNFSKNLGGNFFIDNAFLDISGDAKICQGCVDTSSNTSDDNAWGGALYVEGNSKVTMTGGEISGNTAKAKSSKFACAGVYLLKEFEMTGGVIEGNVVEGGLSSGGAFRVGGLLTIGGSAKIPYGGGEGKNDVYVCKDGGAYKVVQIAASGFSYAASDSAPAAVLAPQDWQRNYSIIKAPSGSDIGAYTPYFKTIDPDFYFGRQSSTVDTAKLKAALCVSNKANAADSVEQNGTKSQPFRTIAFALTKLSGGEPDEIIIDYDSTRGAFGPQRIPATFTTANCSALTIRGANGLYTSGANQGEPKDILDAGGTENVGSALSIASSVPITIKDLKITGGNKGYTNSNDNPNNGGGVSLFENASLTLADGVQIAGNKAVNSGGGVYVPSGASLYMYGTSCIGDNTQTTASGDTLGSACSNSASYGGGIYNNGKVYLGYKNEGGEIKEAEWTGGVRRNYASTNGGGIYSYSTGDLKMRAGEISYNASHDNYWGGGLGVASNASDGHSVELLGGEIKENSASLGGAVYVDGAFSMQGALSIPFGVAGVKGSGKNDIYLKAGQTVKVAGALSSPDGDATVATLMPEGVKRTRKILSASSEALINDNKDKFALTSDNDGWQKKYVSDSGHYAELNSPVYVVGTQTSGSTKPDDTWGWGKPSTNAPNGTKTSPYSSVADALGCAELASATEPNTIIIAGILKGAPQSISGTSVPSDLSLKGYKTATSSAMIDAGGTTDAGSALTVNKSGLTVTITDLTITGGTGSDPSGGTAKNGGGIYINAGTVKLADGAVITGNTVTTNGGGVYLAGSGCALYMSGKALIGDSATSPTRAASGASNRANQAGNGAGIYNNGGSVFIGSNASGTATGFALVNNDTDGHYGVRRNYSTSHGGGIYNGGTLKIASGDISLNSAGSSSGTGSEGGAIYCAANCSINGGSFTNNFANSGGVLYIPSGKSAEIGGAAVFTANKASMIGGVVCNYGDFTMSAGTIGGSNDTDVNTVTSNFGGAIFQEGTFNVSGTAYIYPGSEKKNDVYLRSGKTITIAGAWNGSQAAGSRMTVTPSSYSRGRDILSSNSANATNLSDAIEKFKLSQDDSGWDRGNNLATSETTKKVWITSPIYVAGASGGDVCSAPPASGNNGTKAKPYATIAAALADSELSKVDYTITIDGSLSAQTIANTTTVADGVDAVTLQGYSSSAKIDGGATAIALDIGKSLTYTIEDLQITNGKASSGGGIYLRAGTVNLDSGAKVSGNKATASGAGVYVASGATLNIKDGSEISSNAAYSGDISGGGVYNMGTVNMSGGSIKSNSAKNGGGIYNNSGTFSLTGGAIGGSGIANSATNGGGVYQSGTFKMQGAAVVDSSNDVYLNSGNTITVADTITPPGGVTSVATLTLKEWKRGTYFLTATKANVNKMVAAESKFTFSKDPTGWEKKDDSTTSIAATRYAWITSPIYVASSGTDTTRKVCSAPPESGNNGTKTSPYATIAAALADNELSTVDNTITIDGTLSAQTIASVTLPAGVTSVTLKGYMAESATSSEAAINGGGTTHALSISKSATYTIKNLQITNGTAQNGGGIYLTAGTVTLDSGAKVFSNKAKANGTTKGRGAGVYVASGATLNIKDGAEIYSNTTASGDISGGGVYNMGTVDMSGGSIYNNSAYDGGGINNNSGKLYVRRSAIIGAGSGTTATGSAAGSTCSNSASNYGGGIYNDSSATLYFGCDADGATPTGYSLESSAGVRRNYANHGGGIYNLGTFKSASGLISDNLAANVGGGMYAGGATNNLGGLGISNNMSNWKAGGLYVASSITATITSATGINSNTVTQSSGSDDVMGGGIYIAGTLTATETLNASSNSATITGTSSIGKAYGGCVYIVDGGTFTFAKGQLGTSGNLNSVSNSASAAKAYGGAVYNEGTFEVKGSGYVLPGSLKSNDVYLASGKCVTLPANSYTGNTSSSKMALTLATWKRGTQVLDGSYAATYYDCFKCTDTEWSVGYNAGGDWTLNTDLKTRVGADIYVASSLASGHGRASGISAPPSTASERIGTKAKPYSSISEGVNACWNSGLPFTINMSGKISGADQTIPAATTTTGLASAITIAGVTGNSSDIIDRNLTSAPTSGGSALTISTATPVTLKDIKITKGYSKTHGGGILVNGVKAASLTLTTGALVTANQATNNGGGIYFVGTSASGGTANLTMNDTAKIDGNTANGTATSQGGGGVYLSYANLCMSGKSVIGDTTGTAAATNTSGGYSNKAQYGGGVLASTGGNVYVGYKTTGAKDTTYTTDYGILHNYSTKDGGGIYFVGASSADGNSYLAYGSISKNGAAANGGGVHIGQNRKLTMSDGEFALNKGASGGAVSVNGTFAMSSGTIGNASKDTAATNASNCSNYATSSDDGGGAIWAGSGSTVTVSGGTIAYNLASTAGGAIYACGTSVSKATVNLSGGTVKLNKATNGGGVYIQLYAEVNLSAGAIDGNTATNGGGVYVDGTSTSPSPRGKLLISGSGLIGKTGNTIASTSTYGNRATNGGGIYNKGTVCIGYSAWTSSSNNTPVACSGGVRRNYAGSTGGGICSEEDYIYLHAGNIAYNCSNANGGGIALKDNTQYAYVSMDGGTISYNQCESTDGTKGAGIYAQHGSITVTGGTINNNTKAQKGGGVYLDTESSLYMKNASGKTTSGEIKSNTATYGGAVYMDQCDTAHGINLYGAASIPKGSDEKNDIYVNATSSDKPKISMTDTLTNSSISLVTGSTNFYAEDYQILKFGGSPNQGNAAKIEIKSQSSQDWTVVTESFAGKLAKAKKLTSSNITSFTPTASTSYNFVIDSTVDAAKMKTFLESMCNKTVNTSSTKIAASTLDLSKSSLTSFGNMTFDVENLVEQPITKVILPATDCSAALGDYRVRLCFAGVKEFVVPPGSTALSSSDGIVYNANKTKLIAYPASKTGNTLSWLSSVTEVGTHAFCYAKNLRTMNIPSTVTTIGGQAFMRAKITSVSIPSSVTSIGGEVFVYCTDLTSTTVSNSLISQREFGYCSSLTSVTLSGVTKIEGVAFEGSGAKSITIPASVVHIGYRAFPSTMTSMTFAKTDKWKYYKRVTDSSETYEGVVSSTQLNATNYNSTWYNKVLKYGN